MEPELVYNASVPCSNHILGLDKRRAGSVDNNDVMTNGPTLEHASSFYQSQISSQSLNDRDLEELEVASFKTACDSSPVADVGDLDALLVTEDKFVVDRKPRHRTVDIATLKEIARTIEIDTILDGYEDILDEGAPSKMPNNLLTCYFEAKLRKNVRTSPAISVSTADTTGSIPGSPMFLPEQRSSLRTSDRLTLHTDVELRTTSEATSFVTAESDDAKSEVASSVINAEQEINQGQPVTEPEPEVAQKEASVVAATTPDSPKTKCACGEPAHYLAHDPEIPIKPDKALKPFSYEEGVRLASAECGHWITIIERSQSLDAQYKHMGLSYMKRSIMNRIAVPLTFFLEVSQHTAGPITI
eukprot:Selendium_serpulae@DN2965_c0_g1_i4.p1